MAHAAVERTLDSAGDRAASAPALKPREENNNEVEALSKELSGMGCIVDAVRSPPGCADSDAASVHTDNQPAESEDAYLSEEFESSGSELEEEDSCGREEDAGAGERGLAKLHPQAPPASSVAFTDRMRPAVRSSGDTCTRSTSRYGSLPAQTRRVNMSFTNDRMREIERENRILLNKILSARNSKHSSVLPPAAPSAARSATAASSAAARLRRPPPPAALARRQRQQRIDQDNMILLRKIQRASASSCSLRR